MSIPSLVQDVSALRAAVLEAEERHADLLDAVRDHHRASARNLIHYVAVRSHDLRDLQDRLTDVGVSSLGRMEAGVLGHLGIVLRALRAQLGETRPPEQEDAADPGAALTPARGRAILERNTVRLLGEPAPDRRPRIMVTMPSAAASDRDLVGEMVESGMDLARVNCAHDDEDAWRSMIEATRSHCTPDGRTPLVAMDLAGPKLRTGPLEPGPGVRRVRPRRDDSGSVLERSLVALGRFDDQKAPGEPAASLPLAGDDAQIRAVLATLRAGDEIQLTDARGAPRTLGVEAVDEAGLLVSADRTVYWGSGTALRTGPKRPALVIGDLPPVEQSLRVRVGDEIVLTRSMERRQAVSEPPFVIGCSPPEVFEAVSEGERVLFDDGTISSRITEHSEDEIRVRVDSAGPSGTRLKAGKGINLPDTGLDIDALTEEDLAHVPFVAAHADIVNMSFVHSAADVAALIDALDAEGHRGVDITLKVETVPAFEALPRMLLEAMRWEDVGVMIARGDLAVEAGFGRMAELQEEILWLCEAAHVPAIWATQVLEGLAKSGLPSRAEITDAAMAQRAEGVMLNKGPFIADAIAELSEILSRMEGHSDKKRDMLRKLGSWAL